MISDQKILEQYKLSIERDIKELLQEKMGVFIKLCHFKNHLPNFSLSGK
jgi:AMMECR1 domain-containing protein